MEGGARGGATLSVERGAAMNRAHCVSATFLGKGNPVMRRLGVEETIGKGSQQRSVAGSVHVAEHRSRDARLSYRLRRGRMGSAVKTFTVQELDREPAAVLDACDREGAVRIRRRNGRTYTIRPDTGPDRITDLPDFRARMAKIFPKPIPAAQTRLVDKLLAG